MKSENNKNYKLYYQMFLLSVVILYNVLVNSEHLALFYQDSCSTATKERCNSWFKLQHRHH